MASTLVHIGVRASNIDRTIRFWRDALGLDVVNELHHGFDLSDGYHNFRVFPARGTGPSGSCVRHARLPCTSV